MYANLTTLPAVKRILKIADIETADDELLTSLIESASDLIGRYCSRDNLGEVITYAETYWQRPPSGVTTFKFPNVLLNHYPAVTITSAVSGTRDLPVLTTVETETVSGVFLQDDRRTLSFLNTPWLQSVAPLIVTYTAGYAPADIPGGLALAARMLVIELYRSPQSLGYKSRGVSGENQVFDDFTKFGMSGRIAAMLQPYRNMVPPAGPR